MFGESFNVEIRLGFSFLYQMLRVILDYGLSYQVMNKYYTYGDVKMEKMGRVRLLDVVYVGV